MNKYLDSKIYCITSLYSDKVYIGSTTKSLAKRLKHHEFVYRRYLLGTKSHYYTSFELLKLGGCSIHLLLTSPCENQKELRKLEGKWQRIFESRTVNQRRAGQTLTDSKKHYYLKNKDKINQHKNQKFICSVCHGKYTRGGRSQHSKTNKHVTALQIFRSTVASTTNQFMNK